MAAAALGYLLVAMVSSAQSPTRSQIETVTFNRDIRPILSDSCYTCHGPDDGTRKAGLRLDIREAATAERDGLTAIVPGDAAASAVIKRVNHTDANYRMPPADSERTITAEEIALLARWIDQGAEYEPHWALISPKKPMPPEIHGDDWSRNAIDTFILRTLTENDLEPSSEADRITLIRRVSFDLVGLPPTPGQVEAFLEEDSPGAYERLVDRLLASPAYGERMAIDWLDQVRYADSNGYHSDEERSIYPYRDYVIKSFNENKPYDIFTIEQLAGDLLPNATREQKIASGFNRLNQITAEGGAQAKEYLAKYAADRVRAVSSVWMGATMGCAECHDHKFDPYTMRDFYSMEAFFADIQEVGVYPGRSNWKPVLQLPTPDEKAQEAVYRTQIAALEMSLKMPDAALAGERRDWEESVRHKVADGGRGGWLAVKPASVTSQEGATLDVLDDASVLVTGKSADHDVYTVTLPTDHSRITGLRIDALPHPTIPNGLAREADGFDLSEISAAVTRGDDSIPIPLASAAANFKNDEHPVSSAIDSDDATAWRVESADKAVAAITFGDPVEGGPGTTITVKLKHESQAAKRIIGRFRIALTTNDVIEPIDDTPVPEHLLPAILKDESDRTEEEAGAVNAYYRAISPNLNNLRFQLADLQRQLQAHKGNYAHTLVTKSVEPRTIRILPRGNWMDDSGEIVQPDVPAVLHELNVEDRRATRLDLAKWLMADENPLTGRVFVNRLWAQFFGTGISKVLDDLGAQGEWPAHPELLDWLAVEFRDSGWDIKHMVRLIVTSATYRQSSHADDALRKADPYNRLLARQSRFRLEAELVRDNALAVSGLLVKGIGGPSVRPYQPAGYWSNLNFPKRTYVESTGKQLYRRGLYTHWQRSFLHPSLLAFDAPSREECVAQRTISNTPLQALVLLNDPIYVEAARVFAERIMREGGSSKTERLAFAYRWALSRQPGDAEAGVMSALFDKHLAHFRANPEEATKAVSTGEWPVATEFNTPELAAWTSVARTLLNLHETITRN